MSVDDLTGYLTNNSTAFQELGYDTTDALALLISLSDSGANVGSVMGGMTKAVTNLSGVTKDVPGTGQQAIQAIGDCDTVSEALQAQVGDTGKTVEDIFGKKAAQELAVNIQNGNFQIDKWTEALQNNEGFMEPGNQQREPGTVTDVRASYIGRSEASGGSCNEDRAGGAEQS